MNLLRNECQTHTDPSVIKLEEYYSLRKQVLHNVCQISMKHFYGKYSLTSLTLKGVEASFKNLKPIPVICMNRFF